MTDRPDRNTWREFILSQPNLPRSLTSVSIDTSLARFRVCHACSPAPPSEKQQQTTQRTIKAALRRGEPRRRRPRKPTRPRRSSSRARKTQTSPIEIAASKKARAIAGIDPDCEPFHSVRPDICLNSAKSKIQGSQYWGTRQTICEPFGVISAAIVSLARGPSSEPNGLHQMSKRLRTVTGLEDAFLAPCIGSSVYE